ncbi:lactadherin-like [Clavelina lepadiformis]|uniref:lactadherin-like n=1 Tax=Clavelina lepadiformis TaxID=159417 RepID=UPI00404141BB
MFQAFRLFYVLVVAIVVRGDSDEVCLKLPNRGSNDEGRHLPLAQGPPGRRGPQGAQGAKGDVGLPGVRGLPGSCTCDPDDIEEMRTEIRRLADSVAKLSATNHQHNDKLTHCSVGLKDGRVRDQDITASSSWARGQTPNYARLDNQMASGNIGAWASGIAGSQSAKAGDWIQVDLKVPTFVTAVVTQGRPHDHEQWVTSYKIAYGNSTETLQIIQENGSDVIFQGNRDRSSHVTNRFPAPIVARYLRLIVQSFQSHIILRMEYLTC